MMKIPSIAQFYHCECIFFRYYTYICDVFIKESTNMKFRNLFVAIFAMVALLAVSCDKSGDNNGGSGLSDMTFSIKVSDISAVSAMVEVTPSDVTALYYFDKVEKSVYAASNSDMEFMKGRINHLKAWCESQGATPVSSISVGTDSYTYQNELTPDTDYYIFAFGVDSRLNPVTKLALKGFHTEKAVASNNTFAISVDGGTITITPSNNDQYFWDVVPSDSYAGESDAYIMNDLISQRKGTLSYYLVSGVDTYDYSGYLTAGESYTVYAFGYNGAPNTALTSYVFTYSGSGSGDDSGSGSTGGEDDSTTLTSDITVTPTDAEAYYYGDFYENNTQNWIVVLYNATEELAVECLSAANATTPVGQYTITDYAVNDNDYVTNVVGDAFAGDFSEDGEILPTYYMAGEGEYATTWALVMSGTISVSASGSNYNITANFADALGNKIKANYTGAMPIAEGEISTASVAVKSALNRSRAHRTLGRFCSVAHLRTPKASPKAVRAK